ncbi:MAG: hypothetical protein HUJ95_02325 [Bacteroidales bacterium]|nr:hypothetical protein [Bacteroidales bacterium]
MVQYRIETKINSGILLFLISLVLSATSHAGTLKDGFVADNLSDNPAAATADTLVDGVVADTLSRAVVSADRNNPTITIREASVIALDAISLERLPKFLGSADPIRYIQTVSGVMTNNESTAGVYVQGCDESASAIMIGDAAVYYPNHLLGIGSGFIGSHLKEVSLEKSIHGASSPNRIGGLINIVPDSSIPRNFTGNVTLGLIASEATLKTPMGKKASFNFSARASYINAIFGPLLKFEDFRTGYGYQDMNMTMGFQPTANDKIVLTSYFGRDQMNLYDKTSTDIVPRWRNGAVSLSWDHHFSDGNLSHTAIWASHYGNNLKLWTGTISASSRSNILSYGVRQRFDISVGESGNIQTGFEYTLNQTLPLWINSTGEDVIVQRDVKYDFAHEASIFADYMFHKGIFGLKAGVKGTFWHNGGPMLSLDPRLSLSFDVAPKHTLTFHAGLYHQYLHKIAIFDCGLPGDFWTVASKDLPSEMAISTTLAYNWSSTDDMWSIAAEVYGKRIFRTAKCAASVISLVDKQFDYASAMCIGDGYNYGFDLTATKTRGIFKGYVSYSFCMAMRRFEKLGYYWIPADNTRRHNLNIVATVNPWRNWNFGASFVLATGTPYTAPRYSYIVANRIIAQYSAYNANFLPLTHRLDISADWTVLNRGRHTLVIDLSVYNVYSHSNIQFILPMSQSALTLKQIALLAIPIPSLSLTYRF